MVRKIDYGYLQNTSNVSRAKRVYKNKGVSNGSKINEVIRKITVLDNRPNTSRDTIKSKSELNRNDVLEPRKVGAKSMSFSKTEVKEKSTFDKVLDRIRKLR